MTTDWKHNVVKSFDASSVTYDDVCEIQAQVSDSLALDLPARARTILEIGCGTGNFTKILADKYPNAALDIIDISPSMLEEAKSKVHHSNIRFFVMDGENVNAEQKYDMIVANMVVQWFEDVSQSLADLSKLLHPGGVVLYSMPGPESFKEWVSVLNSLGYQKGILDFPKTTDIYREDYIAQQCVSGIEFLRDIKRLGAATPRKDYKPLSVQQIKQACSVFDQSHDKKITWHILYGRVQPLGGS